MDEADHAQIYEETEREAGILALRHRNKEMQLVIQGQVICLLCLLPVPKARLDANAQSVRCFECQVDIDNKKRVYANG